ncbi:hypothetical protein C464_08145 [Halorubrum coriense DSM 10284]|uniref:Uncharacterized protein n=1 Tax=Halorubrum coriense DSM 10284 TaxID=1227466 RepID=M0ELV7_9EURY|nr:hypothetical protein [Halorubrum coriense]ELZ47877.1 hypothetical protein C464_08145 [Halorubrum coriense DSM 10284]
MADDDTQSGFDDVGEEGELVTASMMGPSPETVRLGGAISTTRILIEIDREEEGASYRATAGGLTMTRQSLSRIHQDDERRGWYLDARADNERVDEALADISTQ